MNVVDQFTQVYEWECEYVKDMCDLGEIVVNRNSTEKTRISGSVWGADTKKAVGNAQITLNYSSPLYLDVQRVKSDGKGEFEVKDELMKLLLYGVQISIVADGYKEWHCKNRLPKVCKDGLVLYD